MARELAPCGTHAAYKRHRRRGEEPCQECREAARDYTRKRREGDSTLHAAVARMAEQAGTDSQTVSQLVAYGQTAEVAVPTFEDPLEAARWRLRRVRAAMLVAPPRDVAPLARAEADAVAEIAQLTGKRTSQPSALDQLAEKRARRLADAKGNGA